jgi:hypothetical protein
MRWLALILPALLGAATDGPITAIEVKGAATAKGSGLPLGASFTPEATVVTAKDSQVVLWLSNGSKLTITPDAEVIVRTLKLTGDPIAPSPDGKSIRESAPSLTDIEVVRGKVIGDVKKLVPNSVYTLKTPVGTVRIKGTVFAVEFRRNADGTAIFNVGCARGLVSVEMPGASAPMPVKAGQQMSATASKEGGPPPPPPKLIPLPPSPEVQAAVASNGAPPPPPPPPPGPPPPAAVLDNIMQRVQQDVISGQVDPSPTGG